MRQREIIPLPHGAFVSVFGEITVRIVLMVLWRCISDRSGNTWDIRGICNFSIPAGNFSSSCPVHNGGV